MWIILLNYIYQLFFNYSFQWLETAYGFPIIRGRSLQNAVFFSLLEEQSQKFHLPEPMYALYYDRN